MALETATGMAERVAPHKIMLQRAAKKQLMNPKLGKMQALNIMLLVLHPIEATSWIFTNQRFWELLMIPTVHIMF